MEVILTIAFIVLAIVFYFLPALIADKRKVAAAGTIAWVNFFFGWTILGWIAALIWAVAEAPIAPAALPRDDPEQRDCPACYSKIDPRATICPHCRTAVERLGSADAEAPASPKPNPYYR